MTKWEEEKIWKESNEKATKTYGKNRITRARMRKKTCKREGLEQDQKSQVQEEETHDKVGEYEVQKDEEETEEDNK